MLRAVLSLFRLTSVQKTPTQVLGQGEGRNQQQNQNGRRLSQSVLTSLIRLHGTSSLGEPLPFWLHYENVTCPENSIRRAILGYSVLLDQNFCVQETVHSRAGETRRTQSERGQFHPPAGYCCQLDFLPPVCAGAVPEAATSMVTGREESPSSLHCRIFLSSLNLWRLRALFAAWALSFWSRTTP